MIELKRTNWKVVKHDYLTSNITLKDLAAKYHINVGTLRSHKSRNHWKRGSKSSHKNVATQRKKNATLHSNVATKIHPDLLDNDKLSEKQKAFAYYYIKYFGNAYRAALKAGYSKETSKNARRDILENLGLRKVIRAKFKSALSSNSHQEASFNDLLINQINIGAGVDLKRRYKKLDHRDPTQDTDVTLIGPASTRDQVNAGKTIIQFGGDLTKAKIDNINAKTELTKSKLPSHQNHRKRTPLFLDSVVKYHRNHEEKLNNKNKK